MGIHMSTKGNSSANGNGRNGSAGVAPDSRRSPRPSMQAYRSAVDSRGMEISWRQILDMAELMDRAERDRGKELGEGKREGI